MTTEPTYEEAAKAYIAYAHDQSMDHFWAVEGATTLAMEKRWDDLWHFVLIAIEQADFDDTQALALIAAGPLEDLVRYAIDEVEPRIVERVKADAKFRRVLTGVWARKERADFWYRITPLLYEYPTQPLT